MITRDLFKNRVRNDIVMEKLSEQWSYRKKMEVLQNFYLRMRIAPKLNNTA